MLLHQGEHPLLGRRELQRHRDSPICRCDLDRQQFHVHEGDARLDGLADLADDIDGPAGEDAIGDLRILGESDGDPPGSLGRPNCRLCSSAGPFPTAVVAGSTTTSVDIVSSSR
jgi:hypothetical protein